MEAIVAPLNRVTFKIEHTLNRQTGLGTCMFPGMDSMWRAHAALCAEHPIA